MSSETVNLFIGVAAWGILALVVLLMIFDYYRWWQELKRLAKRIDDLEKK